MIWDSNLIALRNTLAGLFPTDGEAAALLDEAGISTLRMAFRGSAELMWHGIVDEVVKQERLPELLKAARSKYPNRQELAGDQRALPAAVAEGSQPARGIDLVVLTAMPEELVPVFGLIGGRDRWREESRDGFLQYRAAWTCVEASIEVLAMHAEDFGGTPAAAAVGWLSSLRPRMLAMVGICAGRVGEEIRIGDVLVADRAFDPNEGKKTPGGFQPDTTTHSPPAWLKQQLRGHVQFGQPSADASGAPQQEGRRPKAHVVAFASGAEILAVEAPFAKARKQVRKTSGYDLEVKSFLSAAYSRSIPAFAVKGVCDAATPGKDDTAHAHAAEAAARWMHSFVFATARHWPN